MEDKEQLIEEVMELVEDLFDSTNYEADHPWLDSQAPKLKEAIRAKLREVLERRPLTAQEIDDIWVEHGLDECGAVDFARAVEKHHNIGAVQ